MYLPTLHLETKLTKFKKIESKNTMRLKSVLFLFLLLVLGCKNDIQELSPTSLINGQTELLTKADGSSILSGSGSQPKKWYVLRFYSAKSGDISTQKADYLGVVNSNLQTDKLKNLPSSLKKAEISFNSITSGTLGYGGVQNGQFEIKINGGNRLLNSSGTFNLNSGFTPFYKSSYPGIFVDRMVIPTIHIESGKLDFDGETYKGEFLQLVSTETNSLLDFPATVVLLYSPS